ncbi:hypothetical protein TPHA_0K01820 [Tetrapisispora phaffii CBS 4417]|uniref:Ras-related protein RSR1 n=1 Tax=Tetrapisispora phaffii (strain ATCC 24235 / CBS 4417 / NBRC 1672 / NRRL Y-8282 / UCD 70-5) TaxID=1071381 RepID=G8BZI6_TETPH|nr:hypothetical protein TPHA_0K01820 [Tetrapisispora phaffii CBS 4417]CCE65314.1 hypothetical protein TPHA_0K01820 [Tetrapisispora phaffii CBS 4417]
MRDYKLVVLGAGGVGKSCLTVQFVQGVYLDTYDPTIEDSYRKTIEIDNKLFDLEILDTAGVAQFTAMRELYIKSGMGFLLVYSVTDKNSLNELLELREQVLKIKDSNKVPMVLVGNKADLKYDRVISVEDGIEVSSRWGRVPFYETSALLRSNVDEVFVDLVRQIIRDELENVNNNTNNQNNGINGGARRNPSLGNMKMGRTMSSASRNSISNLNHSPSRMASRSNMDARPITSTNTSSADASNSKRPSSNNKNSNAMPSPDNTDSSGIDKTQNVKQASTSAEIKSKKNSDINNNTNKNISSASENRKNKKKKKSLCTIL